MVQITAKPPGLSTAVVDAATGATTVSTGNVTLTLGSGHRSADPTPVDLLGAALAGCIALSLRAAVKQAGLGDVVTGMTVSARPHKATDLPSRIAGIELHVDIAGAIDDATRHRLIEHAERLCTVGNTLRALPTPMPTALGPAS